MFVRTFLVGLVWFFNQARAYVNRNQNGLEEHTTNEEMATILNAVEALTAVINIFLPGSSIFLESRLSPKDERYLAAKSNLREFKASEPKYIRIPAQVMTVEEFNARKSN